MPLGSTFFTSCLHSMLLLLLELRLLLLHLFNSLFQPFCEADYLNTLEKCCKCQKPILDRILRATGKPYHPQVLFSLRDSWDLKLPLWFARRLARGVGQASALLSLKVVGSIFAAQYFLQDPAILVRLVWLYLRGPWVYKALAVLLWAFAGYH